MALTKVGGAQQHPKNVNFEKIFQYILDGIFSNLFFKSPKFRLEWSKQKERRDCQRI